jgi:hypothetical protein
VNWKVRGRGVRREAGVMNKTEQKYADLLSLRARVGEVAHFAFEAVKLRLADKTFYTPDFMVMLADGTIEFHEVKGFWEDDARVKIKVAAETFPFVFRAMSPIKGGDWKHEEF